MVNDSSNTISGCQYKKCKTKFIENIKLCDNETINFDDCIEINTQKITYAT